MKQSLKNCLKAVRKIEGTKLEDELGEGCYLYVREETVDEGSYGVDEGVHKVLYTSPKKVTITYLLSQFKRSAYLDRNEIKWGMKMDKFNLTNEYKILGNPNNFLQRVLGALNKKLGATDINDECLLIQDVIIDIAFESIWNHSKDIQEDSTYDKITELLR